MVCSKRAAGDVRPETAPDLQRAVGDEPAQRLADGRPADAVAVHQLELGLDPGAGGQLTGPDPVAQVGLDPAIERPTLDARDMVSP